MKKIILIVLLWPYVFLGQVTFNSIPLDKQLVARDLDTNLGEIIIEGQVNNALTPYDKIKVNVYRDTNLFASENKSLEYSGNFAAFSFKFNIVSELVNYSIEIIGIKGTNETIEKTVNSLVAGDVYIIQGQSNAEARIREGSSSAYISDFIRVYGNGTEIVNKVLSNDNWYVGQGDGGRRTDGNTGQWGLKLSYLIQENLKYPVAIFNAGHGPNSIDFFQRPPDYESSQSSNYGRLYYRLKKTGLLKNVRAIFWAQGEEDGNIGTSTNTYINSFNSLLNSWEEDYPGVEQVYIFQTNNGCRIDINSMMKIKEAQRQIAESTIKVHIIPTSSLSKSKGDDCHFSFIDGYDIFANRLYDLVASNLYAIPSEKEIEAPSITSAYLISDNTLIIETDATELNIDNTPVSGYQINDNGSPSINNIATEANKIIISLSGNPGTSPVISFLGPVSSGTNNFIRNSNGLEIISFYQFPIDISRFTTWDGVAWSNGEPTEFMFANIEGNYNALQGDIEALDLTVGTGFDLNFDANTTNSVIVHGDLKINGSFIIGDQESLVMIDDHASISGNIHKKERSTNRVNTHDITYWSSPVKNETIETVFSNVNKNRIFYFDQSQSSASDPSVAGYWNIWQIASSVMIPGQGYAAEGPNGGTGIHNVDFWGIPNNGIINYELKGFFLDDDALGDKNNNFNLVGNPYPSAINVTDFFDVNKDVIDETIYLWTHATIVSEETKGDFTASDYATYNRSGGTACSIEGIKPRDTIGSAQGFFVRATKSGSLEFNNGMRRANQNTEFFKSMASSSKTESQTPKDRLWLDLKTDQDGFSQILISFTGEATDGIDKGYDAVKIINENPVSFYSLQEKNKLVIQGLPPFSDEKTISLGFKTHVAPRVFNIGINKIEGNLENLTILLEDHKLNVVHDLTQANYSFEQLESDEYNDRFCLRILSKTLAIENPKLNDEEFMFWVSGEDLNFKSRRIVNSIKLYDILGHALIQQNPTKDNFNINLKDLKKGNILILQAVLEDGTIVNRKTIY